MNKFIVLFFLLTINQAFSQDYLIKDQDQVILDNGVIQREITFSHDSLYSSSLILKKDNTGFIGKSKDFSFLVNGKELNGYSGWELMDTRAIEDTTGGNGVRVSLRQIGNNPKVQVELSYMLYPDLPLIRKWVEVKNISSEDINLEALTMEALNTNLSHVHSVVRHNYARMKHLGRFVGEWHDPVVVVHHIPGRRGMALGNETVGVLKRTAYHTEDNNIEIGLTREGQHFPFRKWLEPGESWQSPKSFICLYANRDDSYEVVEEEVNAFIVKHMRPQVIEKKTKPVFVYNTWNPFRTFVNDTLIRDVAKAAAECGVEEFIIDDGWQVNAHGKSSEKGWGSNYGDWLVDTNKFSGGFKPTFDYIKSLGMKPGLWMSVASATEDSRVFQEHPEWFVRGPDGEYGNLHSGSEGFYTASFGTGWYDYIKGKILNLVNEYGLRYVKLDFAVVASAYVNNDSISGSYATDHPYYRDHHESFIVHYERLLQLFDELHREAPELFIDCTFETAGKLQLMDYAFAKHAEGNWLSNFESNSPVGPLRVRQMAWWRAPALPASSLVIGNLPLNDPNVEFCLKSLIGTLPIMLGDPREVPEEKREMLHAWADWMRDMQRKYNYMTYRKDLEGFGEPREGHWDGWQRINFQTGEGGIFGVFRQGTPEDTRTVFLKDLKPYEIYTVRQAPSGKVVLRATGEELMHTDGIPVQMQKEYESKIYEVRIE